MAYVWEYVSTNLAVKTLEFGYKYRVTLSSSGLYGKSVIGTRRSDNVEVVLLKSETATPETVEVSGDDYKSVRVGGSSGNGSNQTGITAGPFTRMPTTPDDTNNPNNVWEFVTASRVNALTLAPDYTYLVRGASSYSYGLKIFGVRRDNEESVILLDTGKGNTGEVGLSSDVYSQAGIIHNPGILSNLFLRKPIIPANGKLKDQASGTVINFAGSPWTILDPVTGYLLKKDSIATRAFDPDSTKSFNTLDNNNIGYYLNTTYYNTLSADDKAFIKTKEWGVGGLDSLEVGTGASTPNLSPAQMRAKENTATITAKIGLLSVSEWRKNSRYHAGTTGFLDVPLGGLFWLRSPLSSNRAVWTVGNDGSLLFYEPNLTNPSVLPALYLDPNTNIVNGTVVYNAEPTLSLNTPNNQTLYENDIFKIDGTAIDSDVGDIVNVYYRINSGTSRAIATGISTGAVIPFNEQLTFKGGVLYKGATAITGALAEGPAHKLEVWSEDNKGGESTVHERTFYVVPNRAPTLTVNPFTPSSGMINNDKITFTGTSADPDGNDVKVTYKLNHNAAVQIHSGPAGLWSFDLLLKDLKDGENTIIVEVTDTYNFKSSKTIKFNKQANLTPLASTVQRYSIVPPAGTAKGVMLWIQRDAAQIVNVEISMTTGSEQEQFVPMTLDTTGPKGDGVEDFFKFQAASAMEKIALKLSWTGDKPITLMTGALIL